MMTQDDANAWKFGVSRPVRPIKALLLGHTGEGKSGSLASLAAAGFNLRVLSTDGEPEILDGLLTDHNGIYRKPMAGLWDQKLADTVLSRLSCIVVTEEYDLIGSQAVPRATAWMRINQTLNNWWDQELGKITSWDSNDVLAIDGLSRVCEAAMNFQLSLNKRLISGPMVGSQGGNDYSATYRLILQWLDYLKCDKVKCNVIVTGHIKFMIEPGENPQSKAAQHDKRGFPQTVGSMISPIVGQYFNHTLRAYENLLTGKHYILTQSDENVSLKSSAPTKVKKQYDLETGLAEYFLAVRGSMQRSAPSGSGQS